MPKALCSSGLFINFMFVCDEESCSKTLPEFWQAVKNKIVISKVAGSFKKRKLVISMIGEIPTNLSD